RSDCIARARGSGGDGPAPVPVGRARRVAAARGAGGFPDGHVARAARRRVRARRNGDRGRTMSSPGSAVLVGSLPRQPLRKAPSRAHAKDPTPRTRGPRRPGVVGERARRDRSANRRLSRPSPAIPHGEGALHGRAYGAVLPPCPRRGRGAPRAPPPVPP